MSAFSESDFLRQLAESAPHVSALGFRLVGVEGLEAVLRVGWREDLVGDPDTQVLAGGVVTALLDHACGMAVWVKLDTFRAISTLDLRIDYMRAAEPGLDLFARAECFKVGRSVAFVRAWAYDRTPADPVAAAQAAFMLHEEGDIRPGRNLKGRAAGGSK